MTLRTALVTCLLACTALAQPRIFFSDLDSGPRNGGESDQGAFVTVYGRGFGSSRGAGQVTIGGGSAAAYPIWTDTKVAFQLGAAANSGEIRLTNSTGTSNGVPFTVRAGSITFITPGGGSGAVQRTVDSMRPGDIAYLRDGVAEARPGSSDGSVSLSRNHGTPGNPKAIVGYPGAVATIGQIATAPCGSTSCTEGVRTPYTSNYWTFANLRLVGNNYGININGAGWRVIGNEVTCPFGSGATACLEGSLATNVKVFGNNVHDVGYNRASSLYHGVYFSTDSNDVDLGWNIVRNIQGCRGIQFNSTALDSTTGFNQYNLTVHDNLIDGTQCDGIVLSTVDPSLGPITVYNNVFVNTGRGPATPENGGTFSCIYAAGYRGTRSGPGKGIIDVFNNTMFNCGTFRSDNGYGGITYARRDTTIEVRLRNNIMVHTNGTPYWVNYDGGLVGLSGSNNLVFGNGTVRPSAITGTITADPRFVNADAGDFRLASNSPARGAGVNTSISTDKDGFPRTGAFDLGAYQSSSGAGGGGGGGGSPTSFTLSAAALEASTTVGVNPASQALTIANSGDRPFDYVTSLDRPWATATPTRGTLVAGANQTITVAFNIAGLAAGTYNAILRIGAGDVQRELSLRLTVAPIRVTDPALTLTTSTLNFSAADPRGPAPAAQTFRVRNTGADGTMMRWTARAEQPWIIVEPAEGTVDASGSGQEVTVRVSLDGLNAGAFNGTILFEADKALNSPTRLQVRLGLGAATITSILNAASYTAGILAPRTLISLFGINLGPAEPQGFELTPDGKNIVMGRGVRVLFDNVPAPVLYAQSNQINAIIPREAANRRNVLVTVDNYGLVSPPFPFEVAHPSPGIFTLNGTGKGLAAALNADATVNTAANPAARGAAVSFYTTGLGDLFLPPGSPNPTPGDGEVLTRSDYQLTLQVDVSVGGQDCTVLYAGAAPGFLVGVYQVNCRLPMGIGTGEQPVVVRGSGNPSAPGVTIAVR